MRKPFGALGLAALAVVALAPTVLGATTRVVVTPTNLQGWVVDTTVLGNQSVPYNFNGPADSDGGNGSFQFGPIAGLGAAKQEMQPPDVNFDVTTFDALSFEYQILAPASVGSTSDQVYVNVYVDSAANGLGFYGSGLSSTGFYDCRYTFVADTANPGWNTLSFSDATSPDSLASRHTSCAATIGGNTGNIQFVRLNGGDTSTNDNNMRAAYDLVEIAIGGNTTLYDFEPYAVATSKDQCKDGGWQTVNRANGSSFKNQGDCIQYVNTGK